MVDLAHTAMVDYISHRADEEIVASGSIQGVPALVFWAEVGPEMQMSFAEKR